MLLSMTGYGCAQGLFDGVEYSVEVRSVNNRYFKASIKLPEAWAVAEADIEKVLRERLNRGTVYLMVRMKIRSERAASGINISVLENYVSQLQSLQWGGETSIRIDLSSLLDLPGVCEVPPLDDLVESTRDNLFGLVGQAIDQLIEMRKHEGEAVEQDLLNQCEEVEGNLVKVSQRSPEVVKDYHQRLQDRLGELIGSGRAVIDSDTLAREVAIYADRCDINEEISRLNGHIDQFRQTCRKGDACGRKLDFVAQEMLREVNTIGSKSNDVEIARCVVDMKTAVDRIKEQVQNVV